jgi:hypothetical protein
VANPGQGDSDADGHGDLCDFTLVSPSDVSVVSASAPPPAFNWLPENLGLFQVQFSTTNAPFAPQFKSKKKLVPGTSLVPTAKLWKKIARLGTGGVDVYWRVVGSVPHSKVQTPSDQVFRITFVP